MKTGTLLLLCLMIARMPKKSFDPPPHFVAMEYKGKSNCIYKVYVTDSLIFGAKVNGYITVQPNFGMGSSIPKEKMHDPESYVARSMDKYDDLLSDHDPTKKWGMGYYPHTGKIEIEAIKTPMNRKGNKELILVGDQHPDHVLSLIK